MKRAALLVFVLGTSCGYDPEEIAGFTPMESGTTEDLADVWGTSLSDMWAVGLHATILHFDGSAWTAKDHPRAGSDIAFHSVFGTSDVVRVGGDDGVILTFANDAWTEESLGAGEAVLNLFTRGESASWYAVTPSTLFQQAGAGSSWAILEAGVGLHQVWESPEGQIVLVGDNIQVFNEIWIPLTFPSDPTLNEPALAVWGVKKNDWWVVFSTGVLGHFDGTTMDTCFSLPPTRDLWGDGPTNFWAAGGDDGKPEIATTAGDNGLQQIRNSTEAQCRWSRIPDENETRRAFFWGVFRESDYQSSKPGTGRELDAVFGATGTVWAVGRKGIIVRGSMSP